MMLKNNNAASYVAEPLKLSDGSELDWHDQADVVVVGYGGAGVCAALEAKAQGADVLAIERFQGGGATTLSGGIVYGGGTPYQQSAGIQDSADEMYNYLKQDINGAVRDETLRRFCNDSNSNFEWLESHGVGFGSRVFTGKRSYPPKDYDIYYSGNESAPSYAEHAVPAPRGHRVSGSGYTGEEFFDALNQSASQHGVRVQDRTVVKRLITDSNDRVIGVEVSRLKPETEAYQQHVNIMKKVNAYQRFIESSALKAAEKLRALEQQGECLYVRANKGVILTTGSFAFNREMVSHYAPKYEQAMPLGTVSCDGSGIVMGQSVGAAAGYMDSVTAWRSISPSEDFVKAIVVNKEGQRFISEDTYLGHLGYAMANQTEQRAWIVMDSGTYWRAYWETLPRLGEEAYLEFRGPLLLNLLFNSTRGKTLTQLAEKIGVDAAGLQAEISNYNEGVLAGQDRFDKKESNRRVINDGAYYAIDISVGSQKFKCPTIPMGGLQVSEESGQVLKEDGSSIAGLYAAGRAAVGIPSGFYVSGSSLADCVFSGRRAGRCVSMSPENS